MLFLRKIMALTLSLMLFLSSGGMTLYLHLCGCEQHIVHEPEPCCSDNAATNAGSDQDCCHEKHRDMGLFNTSGAGAACSMSCCLTLKVHLDVDDFKDSNVRQGIILPAIPLPGFSQQEENSNYLLVSWFDQSSNAPPPSYGIQLLRELSSFRIPSGSVS